VTSTACPGRVIDPQRRAKHLPALAREEAPCDHQVARWVAHAQAPEVDHGTQAAPFDQQVAWQQVSMDPDGRAIPFRCPKGYFPRCGHCVRIKHTVHGCCRGAHGSVSQRQGYAAARRRPAGGIDPLQGNDEPC